MKKFLISLREQKRLRPQGYAKSSSLERDGQIINLSFDRIMKFPRSKYNFEVADNDILKIGKKTKLVQVLGEVNSPGELSVC